MFLRLFWILHRSCSRIHNLLLESCNDRTVSYPKRILLAAHRSVAEEYGKCIRFEGEPHNFLFRIEINSLWPQSRYLLDRPHIFGMPNATFLSLNIPQHNCSLFIFLPNLFILVSKFTQCWDSSGLCELVTKITETCSCKIQIFPDQFQQFSTQISW